MAAQIPRCPTTPPTRTRREPCHHGPQPQLPPPRHRRPAKGLQSDATRWGRERGGPDEAWIRGGPPLGNRAGANRGALPHRRRFPQGPWVSVLRSPAAASESKRRMRNALGIERSPRMRRRPHAAASHLN
jgi:hypothetical protein